MKSSSYIFQLNGYLKSVQRLSGNGTFYGAKEIKFTNDVEESILQEVLSWKGGTSIEYRGKTNIPYRELMNEINKYLVPTSISIDGVNREKFNTYLCRMFSEDISEYFRLFSLDIGCDFDSTFHPLIHGNVYSLDIMNDQYEKSFYFLVEFDDILVLSYFTRKIDQRIRIKGVKVIESKQS